LRKGNVLYNETVSNPARNSCVGHFALPMSPDLMLEEHPSPLKSV
jgi:hypothetical protein